MKKVLPENAILVPDSAKLVFQGVIYQVYQWPQEMFDGLVETFEMLKRADTVGAVCVVEDKIIVLEDEQPHKGMRLSYPTGRIDENDRDLLSAAQREVLEETGYRFKNWRLISVTQPHTKIEWFIHLFLAWEVIDKVDQVLDSGEKIVVKKLPFDKVKQMSIRKEGYLGEVKDVLESVNGIDELLSVSEFEGKEIDR